MGEGFQRRGLIYHSEPIRPSFQRSCPSKGLSSLPWRKRSSSNWWECHPASGLLASKRWLL